MQKQSVWFWVGEFLGALAVFALPIILMFIFYALGYE